MVAHAALQRAHQSAARYCRRRQRLARQKEAGSGALHCSCPAAGPAGGRCVARAAHALPWDCWCWCFPDAPTVPAASWKPASHSADSRWTCHCAATRSGRPPWVAEPDADRPRPWPAPDRRTGRARQEENEEDIPTFRGLADKMVTIRQECAANAFKRDVKKK